MDGLFSSEIEHYLLHNACTIYKILAMPKWIFQFYNLLLWIKIQIYYYKIHEEINFIIIICVNWVSLIVMSVSRYINLNYNTKLMHTTHKWFNIMLYNIRKACGAQILREHHKCPFTLLQGVVFVFMYIYEFVCI